MKKIEKLPSLFSKDEHESLSDCRSQSDTQTNIVFTENDIPERIIHKINTFISEEHLRIEAQWIIKNKMRIPIDDLLLNNVTSILALHKVDYYDVPYIMERYPNECNELIKIYNNQYVIYDILRIYDDEFILLEKYIKDIKEHHKEYLDMINEIQYKYSLLELKLLIDPFNNYIQEMKSTVKSNIELINIIKDNNILKYIGEFCLSIDNIIKNSLTDDKDNMIKPNKPSKSLSELSHDYITLTLKDEFLIMMMGIKCIAYQCGIVPQIKKRIFTFYDKYCKISILQKNKNANITQIQSMIKEKIPLEKIKDDDSIILIMDYIKKDLIEMIIDVDKKEMNPLNTEYATLKEYLISILNYSQTTEKDDFSILLQESINYLLLEYLPFEYSKYIKNLLNNRAEHLILSKCKEVFHHLISPCAIIEKEKTNVFSLMIDQHSNHILCYILNIKGELIKVNEYTQLIKKLTYITKFDEKQKYYNELTELSNSINSFSPSVLAIYANNTKCLILKQLLLSINSNLNIIFSTPLQKQILSELYKQDPKEAALSQGRFAINPLIEVCHQWNLISSGKITLIPYQKLIKSNNQALYVSLENILIHTINKKKYDINAILYFSYYHPVIKFLCGLGEEKGKMMIMNYKKNQETIQSKNDLYLYINKNKIVDNLIECISFYQREDANEIKQIESTTNEELFHMMLQDDNFKEGAIVTTTILNIDYDKKIIQCKILNRELYGYISFNEATQIEDNEIKQILIVILMEIGNLIQCRIMTIDYSNINNIYIELKPVTTKIKDYMSIPQCSKLTYKILSTIFEKKYFKHFNCYQALDFLSFEHPGMFLLRPSFKGSNHLTLDYKILNDFYYHTDILIKDEYYIMQNKEFTSLEELVDKFKIEIYEKVRNIIDNEYFILSNNLNDFEQKLKKQQKGLTLLNEYPYKVIYGYILLDGSVIIEWIKITLNGFMFHKQYFKSIVEIFDYSTKNYETDEYNKFIHEGYDWVYNELLYDNCIAVLEKKVTQFEGEDPNNKVNIDMQSFLGKVNSYPVVKGYNPTEFKVMNLFLNIKRERQIMNPAINTYIQNGLNNEFPSSNNECNNLWNKNFNERNTSSIDSSSSLNWNFFPKYNKNKRCYYCNELGHTKINCPLLIAEENRKPLVDCGGWEKLLAHKGKKEEEEDEVININEKQNVIETYSNTEQTNETNEQNPKSYW